MSDHTRALPGAMELATAVTALTIEGQPVFHDYLLSDPRWVSTGGRLYPPRVKVDDGRIVIQYMTTSERQNIVLSINGACSISAALAALEQFLATRSP